MATYLRKYQLNQHYLSCLYWHLHFIYIYLSNVERIHSHVKLTHVFNAYRHWYWRVCDAWCHSKAALPRCHMLSLPRHAPKQHFEVQRIEKEQWWESLVLSSMMSRAPSYTGSYYYECIYYINHSLECTQHLFVEIFQPFFDSSMRIWSSGADGNLHMLLLTLFVSQMGIDGERIAFGCLISECSYREFPEGTD